MPLRRLLFLLSCVWLIASPSASAATQELLHNGGFEQGTSGWLGAGLSASGCDPFGGQGALRVSSNGLAAFAYQDVAGPLGQGAYGLSGAVMGAAGSPTVTVSLIWFDSDGRELDRDTTQPTTGDAYSPFSLNTSRPAGAERLQVRIAVAAHAAAAICLDNLRLDGPPGPTPTTIATATPSPFPTPTQTPKPSPTVKPTSTPRPTATPRPTSTPRPTATPEPPTPPPAAAVSQDDQQPAATPTTGIPTAPAPGSTATGSVVETPSPTPAFTPVQEVLAATAIRPPQAEAAVLALTPSPPADGDVPMIWLAAGAVFVAALGGSYLYGRWRGG